jgi:hypothetical protein
MDSVPRQLQHDLADRATRIHYTRHIAADAAFGHRQGRIGFNSLPQKPQAVQCSDRRARTRIRAGQP